MTDEGEDQTRDQRAPAEDEPPHAESPWDAFARRGAKAPPRVELAAASPVETLDDDDEMPELGDDDEIDDRDRTSPAAPIALRAGSRPSLPSIDEPLPERARSTDEAPLVVAVPTGEAPLAGVTVPTGEAPLAGVAVPTGEAPLAGVAASIDLPPAPQLVPLVYVPPPIYDVPQGARSVLLHLPLTILLGALGLGLAAGLAGGSLGPFENVVPVICFLAVISGFIHFFASFPTILSAKPATKTLLISSGFAFGLAVLVGLFHSAALRRMGSPSSLRFYPEFFIIAASFSATAYLGAAIVTRRALRCLLLLRAPNEPVDEIADSRAMLAVLVATGATVLVLAIFLGFGLPLNLGLPAFMFMTLVGGAVARTQALAEGAALALDESSPLRARLVPRVSLAQHAYVASAFLGAFVLAMSIRVGLLKAIVYTRYGSGAGVSAAAIDRGLFVAIPFFMAIATASFWLPKLALPRHGTGVSLVAPRGARVTVVLAVLALGMLLRLEDVYERRVAGAREDLITNDERARDEGTK